MERAQTCPASEPLSWTHRTSALSGEQSYLHVLREEEKRAFTQGSLVSGYFIEERTLEKRVDRMCTDGPAFGDP